MTTTSITALPDDAPPATPRSLWRDRRLWLAVAGLGVLFIAYHHVFLQRTWMFAVSDRNWSHAALVPVISLFYIYQHRDRLARAMARFEPGWWGLPILFLGLFGYAFGIYPVRNDMAQGYSMIVALFGAALWLLGPAAMRVLWFPIAYLAFAVKISDRIWEQVAWQLQQVAAEGATLALKFTTVFLSFDVMKRGATIELIMLGGEGGGGVIPLNIAEACSGLRMLMALVALATAVAFLWPRAWWQRLILVAMAVPIAVLVNIMRVTALGLVALVDPELIEGAMHTSIGLSMLLPAAALFWLLGWVLDRCVIREADASDGTGEGSGESASVGVSGETAHAVAPMGGEARSAEGRRDRRLGRVGLTGAAMGVGAALVAGGVYAAMLMTATPRVAVPGVPALVSQSLMELAWTLVPPAAVGGGLAVAMMGLVRRRWGGGVLRAAGCWFTGGVLLTMVLGHGSVLAATRAVLIKEPVPLRHGLWMIPTQLGPWTLEREDPPLSAEQVEVLGTRTYLSRVYRDTEWPRREPGGLARVHVAYYTGTPDTVPHVPERCFVAAGLQGLGQAPDTLRLDEQRWRPAADAAELTGESTGTGAAATGYVSDAELEPLVRTPARRIDVSRFTFAPPGNPERAQNVFYFFVANGRFLATPDMVRLHGFDPTDRYSYYAKVEIQLPEVGDAERARTRAEALLTHLLPELLACLPDWQAVQRGEWPTPEAAAEARASGS